MKNKGLVSGIILSLLIVMSLGLITSCSSGVNTPTATTTTATTQTSTQTSTATQTATTTQAATTSKPITATTAPSTTAATSTTTAPQNVIHIRFGSINAPNHPYSVADEQWMIYVEKQTNGRVKFDRYWASTLISAENGPQEINAGAADIGYTDPAYGKNGFQILKELKNMYAGASIYTTAIAVYESVFAQIPAVLKDYPANTIPIHVYEWAQPFYLWTTKQPINKVEDLKGLSIRTATFNVDVLKAAGAQPVVIPMSETYLQLQKNIVQGVISPTETLASMKFAELVKYQNLYANPSNAAIARMWNRAFFENLPADIQKIIVDSYPYWNKAAIDSMLATTKAGEDAGKAANIQLVAQSPEEKAKWDALYSPVGAAAAKRLDDAGLAGTAVWNAMQKAIDQ
jgi:TRAP-type transport system periplasmic protein